VKFRKRPRRPEDHDESRRPIDGRLVGRLWRYTRPHARTRNWLFLLTIQRSLCIPAIGWGVGHVLGGPIAHADATGTALAVAGFAALLVFTELTFVFRIRLALGLGEALVHDLRRDLFAHLIEMPMAFFHRTSMGRIISRLTSDVENVRLGIQDSVFIGVVQIGTMLGAAAVMAWLDVVLFAAVLGLVPVLWALLRFFHRRLYVAYQDMHESFTRVTSNLAETVGGIRVIQGFGRGERAREDFRALIYDHSGYNLRVARTNAVFAPLLELNGQLFLAVLLVLGGWRVLGGQAQVGDLITFLFLANLFFNPIPVLANQYNQALAAMAAAERIFRVLDTPRAWDDPQDAVRLPAIRGDVELRHVTFGYEPGRAVLHDVSFRVQPGQTVALVGETGGGKSTILSLIAKFYLPDAGAVLVDGCDLAGVARSSLRRQMGIVQQTNFLWSASVLDNIRFGRPEASAEDVRAAARALDVLDLLEDLPQGLDTSVGERGASLSLGQRQIVCFTRAMLANPRLLLLDEATSAVDAMTEARLQRALARLLAERTSFVVAHRLSTIRHADLILVISAGRIVEQGRFGELIAAAGPFAALHR
jgi:ATP-binding cassette subfamily B protein